MYYTAISAVDRNRDRALILAIGLCTFSAAPRHTSLSSNWVHGLITIFEFETNIPES